MVNKSIEGLAIFYETEEQREAIGEYLENNGYSREGVVLKHTYLPGYLRATDSSICFGSSLEIARKTTDSSITFEQFSALTGVKPKPISLSRKYPNTTFTNGDIVISKYLHGTKRNEWKLVYDIRDKGFRLQMMNGALCVTDTIRTENVYPRRLTIKEIQEKLTFADIELMIERKLKQNKHGDQG